MATSATGMSTGANYQATKPYDYSTNKYWQSMGNNWKITPKDYTSQYTNALSSLLSGAGNAGQGMYDIGTTGQGTYDVGDVGQGTYDVGNTGTGRYTSGMLDTLTSKLQGDLTNPLDSTKYNTTMDRIAGQQTADIQSAGDQYAGWGRGSGNVAAALAALNTSAAKEKSEAARTTAKDVYDTAITNSMSLQNLLSGIYEAGKQRDLSNATLANTAYEAGKGRELSKSELSKSAYESAQDRALSGAKIGASAYENAQNRALTNQTNRTSAQTSGLSGLATLLSGQMTNDLSAQNQSYTNLSGLSESQATRDKTAYTDFTSYLKNIQKTNPGLYNALIKKYNETGKISYDATEEDTSTKPGGYY